MLTGNIVSNNELRFKGNGSVDVTGEASLAGSVRALDLSHEPNTTPSLNFTGNVTLTGPMEFEGTSATFTHGVEGKNNGQNNDLTLDFSQTATVTGIRTLRTLLQRVLSISAGTLQQRAPRSTKATLLLVVIPNLSQRLLSSPMASQGT